MHAGNASTFIMCPNIFLNNPIQLFPKFSYPEPEGLLNLTLNIKYPPDFAITSPNAKMSKILDIYTT